MCLSFYSPRASRSRRRDWGDPCAEATVGEVWWGGVGRACAARPAATIPRPVPVEEAYVQVWLSPSWVGRETAPVRGPLRRDQDPPRVSEECAVPGQPRQPAAACPPASQPPAIAVRAAPAAAAPGQPRQLAAACPPASQPPAAAARLALVAAGIHRRAATAPSRWPPALRPRAGQLPAVACVAAPGCLRPPRVPPAPLPTREPPLARRRPRLCTSPRCRRRPLRPPFATLIARWPWRIRAASPVRVMRRRTSVRLSDHGRWQTAARLLCPSSVAAHPGDICAICGSRFPVSAPYVLVCVRGRRTPLAERAVSTLPRP